MHRRSAPTRILLVVFGLGLALTRPLAQTADPGALPDVLKQSIARYATLTSYADTGTLREELPGIVNDAKFTTYFRRETRDLYFDFQELTSTNPENRYTIDMRMNRTVIWMNKGTMEKYELKTHAHQLVSAENGGQTRALQGLIHATTGTSILIPSLLYSKANLPGTLLQIQEAKVAGMEEVDKRRCHKVTGVAASFYPSGQRSNVRPVTVWIDADTQLVRKVFEDTPEARPAGAFARVTVTLQPQANPILDDKQFQFQIPAPQKGVHP
jgi:hypothetical protein